MELSICAPLGTDMNGTSFAPLSPFTGGIRPYLAVSGLDAGALCRLFA